MEMGKICLWFGTGIFLFLSDISPAWGDRGEVLFYASFDQTTAAVYARGEPTAYPSGDPKLESGKRGQALLSGDGIGYVTYAIKDNLLAQEGTIEFWLCSVDWEGSDDQFHTFFDASGTGKLRIWKPADYPEARHNYIGFFVNLMGYGGPHLTAYQTHPHFKPGEWHHIIAIWHPLDFRFYIDGKLCGIAPKLGVPAGLSGRFTVGDCAVSPTPWHEGKLEKKRNARSLVDEFYIYGRALSEAEVLWAYQHANDRTPGEDIPAGVGSPVLGVLATPLGDKNMIGVQVFMNPRRLEKEFKGRVRLQPPVGSGTVAFGRGDLGQTGGIARSEPVAESVPVSLSHVGPDRGEALIPFTEPQKGEYQVLVSVDDSQGKSIGTATDSFLCPGPPVWRGNKLGVSNEPPPPWPPIKGTKRVIQCWGRQYQLGSLGLPSQIESKGENLLARPIELLITDNGKALQWKEVSRAFVGGDKVKVQIKGRARSEIGTLDWQCAGEYDGMIRYDLVLTPVADATLDQLELRFPIRKELSTLYFVSSAKRGATPSALKLPFQNMCWIGNEEVGVTVFCESDEAVDRVNRDDVFQIEQNNDSTEVIWSFVEGRKQLGPWKFTFGIQATPIKEM